MRHVWNSENSPEVAVNLKRYSGNSGVNYLLKEMLDNPNFKLDDTMARIVALLHGTQAEIHFVDTELNPADF